MDYTGHLTPRSLLPGPTTGVSYQSLFVPFKQVSLYFNQTHTHTHGFPDSSVGKESACNAEDPSSIPGSGRSPGEGIGYPLQYSWVFLVAQMVKNSPAMWET